MTLEQWAAESPVACHFHDKAAVVPDVVAEPHRGKLWHLSDYYVSSVTGGSVWLLPRLREDTLE